MGLRPLDVFYFSQCGYRLYMSEFDVHRRQILTYKDGPSTERVKTRILYTVDKFMMSTFILSLLL